MAEEPKPLILHVDDDDANRYAVTRSLTKAGFDVIESATGADALQKVSQLPDLVILDVRLPDIDGFEVCRRIKASPATARIPVLNLSASFTSGRAKAEGLNSGADAYLVRPVEPVELIATVNALLRAHRSEEALRRSEERYRRLIDSIDEGFCTIEVLFETDASGNRRPVDYRFLEVNPAFERQTGLKNATGRRMKELAPEMEAHWFDIYGQVALTGEPVRFEHRAAPLDRYFDVYATRVGDPADACVAIVFNDISRRRHAEEALARQKRFLDGALSSVADFTYSFDRQGRFTFASRSLLDLWGLSWEQASGKNFAELNYAPELAQRLQSQVEQVFQTRQSVTGATEYTSPTGQSGTYEYTFTPVFAPDGSVEVVAGVSRDTTERARFERQREQMLVAERAARAEAEQAGRMKDDFLATLSHELRTPLNSIVGWVQILKTAAQTPDPQDLAEGLAVIDRNAKAQTQIIEDILDMSRIISGKLRLDVQRVDLAALVRAGVDTVQPAADAKGVRLQVLLDPAAGPVSGDPDRLHQVFWNLLSNAVKFTPRGGRVQVLLERVNSHVEVSVIDTGEGIAPAFLPYVFDRFRQADASTTRKHGGLGLGLSIVKQLVEMHGGSVSVKSPGVGQGATFVVALPLTVVHPHPAEPEPVREHPEAEIPIDQHQIACEELVGLNVLVVDDEPDGRAVVKRLLEQCGAIVRTAGSAAQGLELLAMQLPSVIISDIGMPGEDGYAFLRRVRSLPPAQGGTLPAIALTAYARAADRVRVMEAGFQAHLAKPVEPAELIVTTAAMAKTVVSNPR